MKKIIYIVLIIITISLYLSYNNREKYVIPNDALRFRIIANSNDKNDQATKMLIKKDLEQNLFPLLEESTSKEETKNILINNEYIIKDTIEKYNIPYSINLGQNYFPSKEYLGITYDEGNYDSLVINLGESKGDNWWCVMYPPLCLLESQREEKQDIEYTSILNEIYKKLTS